MNRRNILLALALVLSVALTSPGAETNSLVWQPDTQLVTADIRGEALWPLLEDIAHQTGWHIFVEPKANHVASVKFRDVPAGEALGKLLGDLNFALVPRTNGPDELYVFTTTMHAATQRIVAPPPKVVAMKHVANQLMVKLKPGANIDMIAKERGAKVVARNDKLGIYLLQFGDATATDAALAGLKASPDVAAVDYNYIFDPPPAPQQMATVPPGVAPVSLSLNPSTPGDPCNPVVGLIDTGVQSLGSQLDKFMMPGTNVTGYPANISSTVPTHGTAMAETILGAVSQQGSSSSIRILPVNVYGSGESTTTWNVALGVQAAVDGGASVLNMSLAGTQNDAILSDIIQQAIARGVVVFAAAGNQPVSTPNYPAALPGVNAVTALGSPGQLASYANYGSFVNMALPGASVVYLGNQAFVVQGTSAATAYASGVAAGTKSANCLPWSQIEAAMQQKFTVPQTGN
jgi:thermitase